jgi:predicted Zn-dependent protease
VGIALLSASGLTARAARARSYRLEEDRADRLAAQYLVRAGYDPNAPARFFQRLQEETERAGGEAGGILATHPRSLDRQKKLEKVIPQLPPPQFALHDEAEFLRMRQAVRDYDEIYSRVVGVRVPGSDAPAPELSRRPPPPGSH